MLNIEIREAPKGNSKAERNIIVVDGLPDYESMYFELPSRSDTPSIQAAYLYTHQVINNLTGYSFSEVNKHFSLVNLYISTDWWKQKIRIHIDYHYKINDQGIAVEFLLPLEPEKWANLWSIAEFSDVFKSIIDKRSISNITYYQLKSESVTNGFGIKIFVKDQESTIESTLNYAIRYLKEVVEDANKELTEEVKASSLSVFFDFPLEIRVPCKQYLVYFAQFLADIGIEADTELKQEANQTLFTVSPADGKEALSRIKEALVIYLNAPSNPAFQLQTVGHHDLAVIQWKANVLHLESQLMLATATIQAKDAAIEALKLTNYQYSQMLMSKKEEKKGEEILDGLVTVKEYEGPGFSVDTAEILRRLKRAFIKDS